MEELKRWAMMLEDGTITAGEYHEAQKRILEETDRGPVEVLHG